MFMKYLCLFSSDSGIRLAYDTEANTSDVGIPPDALRLLRVGLQPSIMLGVATSGAT